MACMDEGRDSAAARNIGGHYPARSKLLHEIEAALGTGKP